MWPSDQKVWKPLFYTDLLLVVKQHALKQNKNTSIIVYKNAGNRPYSQNFRDPKIGGPRLKPF